MNPVFYSQYIIMFLKHQGYTVLRFLRDITSNIFKLYNSAVYSVPRTLLPQLCGMCMKFGLHESKYRQGVPKVSYRSINRASVAPNNVQS